MTRSADPERLEGGQFLSANPLYRHAAGYSNDTLDRSLDRSIWTAPPDCEITDDGYIRPISKDGAQKRVYRPLVDAPNLFLEFARLPYRNPDEEIVLDWVREYGLLGYGRDHRDDGRTASSFWSLEQWNLDLYGSKRGPADNVRTFFAEVELAAMILEAYEAILADNGNEALGRLFESQFHFPDEYLVTYEDEDGEIVERPLDAEESVSNEAALSFALSAVAKDVDSKLRYCHPGLDWWHIAKYGRDPSDLKQHWRFDNLAGAMYLQMWWLMGSRADIVRCQNPKCRRVISLAAPKEGARKTRNDKRFCDDACRQQYRYHTKIKPARLEARG